MPRKPQDENTPSKESVRARSPTMADIARLAGVSASTVSRSLAGLPEISEETRIRVERAAQEAGYKINRHARSLRLQRSAILLVLIPDLANQNYSDLLMNIDRAAFELGYGIMIGHTNVDLERPDRLADELFTGGIDGILLTSGYCPARIRSRIENGSRLPVVRTMSPTEAGSGIASVQIDEVEAAADVVRHLIANGHRRIAHLAGPMTELVSQLRRDGWRRALAEAGLPEGQDLLLPGGFHLEDGKAVARRLIAAGTLPDAIFCGNDESAFGLMTELKRSGVRIPNDIAVAGFDDLTFSQVFDPPLTTVRLPRREMAEASVLYLKQMIEGGASLEDQIVPHELIIRESSGPGSPHRDRS
ncbi:transcriptional regulator, LacI family [Kaistia soli DSM 19436]|uniref:Transcriptional regulator, LacI family n=1 Tax=Kaistia soli DSM 19436 TaxID=1122133 RepID=A0A1M5PRR1_9HYPH|nr:LacI family DNA-binding transcriptional regulator [Kaistia soli]SHH04410.1 transcriptional regulator, LacI family [Kaistia soli DSM 19436]